MEQQKLRDGGAATCRRYRRFVRPPSTDGTSIPITFRDVSGTRPFVEVFLNEVPFMFMVHANASFYAMTTHATAAVAGIQDLKAQGEYGITAKGEVSALGMASATVPRLVVGGDVVTDAPLVVFEVPQEAAVDGMLGVAWLRDRDAFVDFAESRVLLPKASSDAESERERLLAAGYRSCSMEWDESTSGFLIPITVNGQAARFAVSTVAEVHLDAPFAEKAGIETLSLDELFGGPTGATGDVRVSAGLIEIIIDGKATPPLQVGVFDLYAYSGSDRPPQPDDVVSGDLGADFMLANKAVIDFGSGTLFLI